MNIFKIFITMALLMSSTYGNDDRQPIRYDYLKKSNVKKFIIMMSKKYHFDKSYLVNTLSHAKLDRDTLARYSGRFKKNSTIGSWERFKLHVVNKETFEEAKSFKKKYYRTLKKAERLYQVDMNYIVGFLGVESHFGNYMGDYNILDALATLAFHPNRMQRFFKSELKNLFLFSREKKYNIKKLEGSFAGAMGCVQQVPSIARKFSFDFDGDGASVWDIEDCIGSIAKFMHKNRWKKGATVAVPTQYKGVRFSRLRTTHKKTLGIKTILSAGVKPLKPFHERRAYLIKTRNAKSDDLWIAGRNFKVLTRYNNSANYGVAIHLIAQAVK